MAGLMKGLDHYQLITHIRQGGVYIYSTRLHGRAGKIFEPASLVNITGFTQITGSASHAESFIVTIQEHLPFQWSNLSTHLLTKTSFFRPTGKVVDQDQGSGIIVKHPPGIFRCGRERRAGQTCSIPPAPILTLESDPFRSDHIPWMDRLCPTGSELLCLFEIFSHLSSPLLFATFRSTGWIFLPTYHRTFPHHREKSRREVPSSASDTGYIHNRYLSDYTVHRYSCIWLNSYQYYNLLFSCFLLNRLTQNLSRFEPSYSVPP